MTNFSNSDSIYPYRLNCFCDNPITTHNAVEVNRQVTFKSKIIFEKNFGHGYYYDVIMEEAKLVDTATASIFIVKSCISENYAESKLIWHRPEKQFYIQLA